MCDTSLDLCAHGVGVDVVFHGVDSPGSGSLLDASLVVSMDHMSSSKFITVPALIVHAITVWLVPALTHLSPHVRISAASAIATLLLGSPNTQSESPNGIVPELADCHIRYHAPVFTLVEQEALRTSLSVVVPLLEKFDSVEVTRAPLSELAARLMAWSEGQSSVSIDSSSSRPYRASSSSRGRLGSHESVVLPGQAGAGFSSPGSYRAPPTPSSAVDTARRPSVVGGSTTSVSAGAAAATKYDAGGWPSSVTRHLGRDGVSIPTGVSRQLFHAASSVVGRARSTGASAKKVHEQPLVSPGVATHVQHVTVQSPSLLGLDLGAGVGTIVSACSDPLLVEIRHGVNRHTKQVILYVTVTNVTRLAIPSLTYA